MCAASRSCGFWCIRTASSTTSGPWAWLPSSPAHAGVDLVRMSDQAENRRVVDKTLDRLELLVGHITFDLNLCGDVRDASVGLGPLDLEQHAGIEVARDLDLNPFQFDSMPGSIESYGRGHTCGESAKRHFHRLSTITRSHKPYRFFASPPAAIRDCVEPVSKSFDENNEAGKLDKAEEIVGVVLPANEDPALPLNPGEEALDEPASHVAA